MPLVRAAGAGSKRRGAAVDALVGAVAVLVDADGTAGARAVARRAAKYTVFLVPHVLVNAVRAAGTRTIRRGIAIDAVVSHEHPLVEDQSLKFSVFLIAPAIGHTVCSS